MDLELLLYIRMLDNLFTYIFFGLNFGFFGGLLKEKRYFFLLLVIIIELLFRS